MFNLPMCWGWLIVGRLYTCSYAFVLQPRKQVLPASLREVSLPGQRLETAAAAAAQKTRPPRERHQGIPQQASQHNLLARYVMGLEPQSDKTLYSKELKSNPWKYFWDSFERYLRVVDHYQIKFASLDIF